MTLAEFKAWFEGFTEGMSDVPNEAQWKRIQARVAQIDGTVTTERVFIDRYWPIGRVYSTPLWPSTVTVPMWSSTCGAEIPAHNAGPSVYCSSAAMSVLGRSDAQAIASS